MRLGLGDIGFLAYTYQWGECSYPQGEESRQTLRQGSVGGAMPSQFVQRLYKIILFITTHHLPDLLAYCALSRGSLNSVTRGDIPKIEHSRVSGEPAWFLPLYMKVKVA